MSGHNFHGYAPDFNYNIGVGTGYGSSQGQTAGGSQGTNASAYGGNTLGTTTSQNQYLIPGALPAAQAISGGLAGGYSGLADQLRDAWGGLRGDVLGGYGNLFGQSQDLVNTFGVTQREQTRRAYEQARAKSDQDLISRGLGNTTVRAGAQQGLTESEQFANNALEEQINREKLGNLSQFGMPLVGAASQLGQAQIGQHGQLGEQGLNAQQALGQ